MPTNAALAAIFIGVEPPDAPSPTTRWISQSHRHLQIPAGPKSRTPIIGSYKGDGTCQEPSPWWNPILKRWEMLFTLSSSQYFSYADDPRGPWSSKVRVLGAGFGGEASNSQQCSVFIENGYIYALYETSGSSTTYYLARATMPATPSAAPVFTKLGAVWTDTVSTAGTGRIIKVNGVYYLFVERGSNMKLATSSAASADDLVTTTFTTVISKTSGMRMAMGARDNKGWGRPMPFYEPSSGTWVLYVHMIGTVDFGIGMICRFTSTDTDLPINWTLDEDSPVLRQVSPLEVDQIADFCAVQGPDEKWWAFWAGNNNPGLEFNILTAPMLEPMMSYSGNRWDMSLGQSDIRADVGYTNPDIVNTTPATIQNQWDVIVDSSSAAMVINLPKAASRSFVRVSNNPSNLIGNPVKLVPVGTDKIMGNNSIVSLSAVGTTVTMVTKRPHNLTTSDFVTVSGATPSGYNIVNAAVASVVDANTITYSAGSSPAANTVKGVYERSIDPGQSVAYRCRGTINQLTWYREG